MSGVGPWGNEDFEAMSWHDVRVHGFWLEAFDEDGGTCDLVLDIDYILEWDPSTCRKSPEGAISFKVCQALLRFNHVYGLKVEMDYTSPPAGMCPLSLNGIEREPKPSFGGRPFYHWRLPVNWPYGMIEFDAEDFSQTLVGTPVDGFSQWLDGDQRLNIRPTPDKSASPRKEAHNCL